MSQLGFVLAAIVGTLAVALWPLLSGSAELTFDARDVGYPTLTFLGDALREGRLPLWDPYTSCGYPYHADPNNPLLSPLAIVITYLTAGSSFGSMLYTVIFFGIGAIGAAFWARQNGASLEGSVVAALSFSCSGFWVGHGQHTGFLVSFALIPFCFAFAERAVRTKRMSDNLAAATCLALSAGGYLLFTVFCALSLTGWLALRVRAGEFDDGAPGFTRARAGRVVGPLLYAAVLLVLFSGPQLYAFFSEGRGYTDRVSELGVKVATEDNVFSLTSFYSFFYPFTSLAARPILGTDISMANGYVGAITLPLAAVWAWKDKKRRYWFLGYCVFMLLLSMGAQAGIRTLVYYLVPPMRFIRHNGTLRAGWMLVVSLAAGLGLTALQRDLTLRSWFLKALSAWGVLALVALFLFNGVITQNKLVATWQQLYLVPLVALGAGLAFTFGLRKSAYLAMALATVCAVDMALHVRGNSMTVWAPPLTIHRVDEAHVRSSSVEGEPGARLRPYAYGFFNVQQVIKKAVAVGYTGMKSEAFDEKLVKSPFVGFLTLPFRAWLSPGAEVAAVDPIGVLMRSDPSSPAPALVDSLPAGSSSERAIAGTFGKVETTRYAPERIDMKVTVPGAAPALLVTSERFGGQWRAFVDETPAAVVRTNVFFRGVWVPPGSHSVRWSYEPTIFVWLLLGAFVLLFANAAAAAWLARQGR